MKKYIYIDFLKVIAMFLVILLHALAPFDINPYWAVMAEEKEPTLAMLVKFLNAGLVPSFIFASGFLFQVSLRKKAKTKLILFKEKALRLLVPYFIYEIFWLVPRYTSLDIKSWGRPQGATLWEGYQAMALGQFTDVAWFLLVLFWVTAIWIACQQLLERKNLIAGSFAAAALGFSAHELFRGFNFYKLDQIDIFIVIFFSGAAFYYAADYVNEQLSAFTLLTVSLAAFALAVYPSQFVLEIYWLQCALQLTLPFFFTFFAMGMCKLPAVQQLMATPALKWLMVNNMNIYLLQTPFIYVGFIHIYPLVKQSPVLCVALVFISTVCVDLTLVRILEILLGVKNRLTAK